MLLKEISFQQNKQVSIVQFQALPQNTIKFVSGAAAIAKNMVEVNEINESGSVNNLYVINHSENMVFFMDGDILMGAKQNRVLNTSILLAANSKHKLPVSCVEQGRWRRNSEKFASSEFISPSKLRAQKAKDVKENLKNKMGYYADQGQVWREVGDYQTAYSIASPTSSLGDVYGEMKNNFDKFISVFRISDAANGMAVFVNHKLMNIEIFNRTDIYAEYFPKVLNGTAMEAFRIKPADDLLKEAEGFYVMHEFMDKVEALPKDIHPGSALGEEKRFETSEATGFSLEYEKELIHFTALNLK
jgi:hypothetical protein